MAPKPQTFRLTNFVHSAKMKKRDFNARVPILRAELLEAQNSLRDAKFPVIVLFAGVDGAGKSEVVKLLNEWMDTRWLINRAYHRSTDSQSTDSRGDEDVPAFRRYWADLPPRGRMGLFLSAWYSPVLLGTVYREVTEADFPRHVERIQRFEENLTMDGALILKFWLHLDKRQQRKRLERLEANPETSWRVNHTDWAHWAMYHRFVDAGDRIIDATETTYAPWQVIDGKNHRHLSITIAEQILNAVKTRLDQPDTSKPKASKPKASKQASKHKPSPVDWLSQVDLEQTLTRKDYRRRLSAAQGELNRLDREARRRGIPSVLAFEGWDAAGKGGAIRRMLRALDPRHYCVIPVAAPTKEEHGQHYLWRFWSHVPTRGQMAIFDRSWYGRVLVERVEGFAEPDEWKRAYFEINEFEKELVENGMMMCKFWLHITPEEQLRRFTERKHTLHKAWKLTDEDWRNRDKWDQYESAVNDMIEYTNTPHAPWTIVPANDKNWARIIVLEAACERLRQILQLPAIVKS